MTFNGIPGESWHSLLINARTSYLDVNELIQKSTLRYQTNKKWYYVVLKEEDQERKMKNMVTRYCAQTHFYYIILIYLTSIYTK